MENKSIYNNHVGSLTINLWNTGQWMDRHSARNIGLEIAKFDTISEALERVKENALNENYTPLEPNTEQSITPQKAIAFDTGKVFTVKKSVVKKTEKPKKDIKGLWQLHLFS